MDEEMSWHEWAVHNIERGCDPSGVAELLEKNGQEDIAVELGISLKQKLVKENMGFDFEVSASLRPNTNGKLFREISNEKISLFVCEKYLEKEICDMLSKLIREHSIPSAVTENSGELNVRTSSTCHLSLCGEKFVDDIDIQISRTMGINVSYSEGIQGQLYSVGNEFKPHTDYFFPNTREYTEHADDRGQRTWTFMIYLNDTQDGGETFFPEINTSFKPCTGMAVVWNNLRPDGSPNPETLHHGKPVIKGEKVIVTKWFRTIGKGNPFLESVKSVEKESLRVETNILTGEKRKCDRVRESQQMTGPLPESFTHNPKNKESIKIRKTQVKEEISECSKLSNRLAKTEWILGTLARLEDLGSGPTVEELESLDEHLFLENYYAKNRPCIVRNYLQENGLKEALRWQNLIKRYGLQKIQLQGGREGSGEYERNKSAHLQEVQFDTFLKSVVNGEESNDRYMTANNGNANRTLVTKMLKGKEICRELLDPEEQDESTFLWIGPMGTLTPLHHDLTNNLMIQICGTKRIKLISPMCFNFIYNDSHCYSAVDVYNIDLESFPDFAKARVCEVDVNEGDLLYIPIAWWHAVEAISPSITITATNFKYRNNFATDHPFVPEML